MKKEIIVENTGTFATKEELQTLKNIARRGWMSGDRVMVFSIQEGINKDNATYSAKEACHRVALKHGLPEIEGFYGIQEDGEFVKR